MNQKAHVTCNFNCLFENEGLLKVTESHVYCEYDNLSNGAKLRLCYYRPL